MKQHENFGYPTPANDSHRFPSMLAAVHGSVRPLAYVGRLPIQYIDCIQEKIGYEKLNVGQPLSNGVCQPASYPICLLSITVCHLSAYHMLLLLLPCVQKVSASQPVQYKPAISFSEFFILRYSKCI